LVEHTFIWFLTERISCFSVSVEAGVAKEGIFPCWEEEVVDGDDFCINSGMLVTTTIRISTIPRMIAARPNSPFFLRGILKAAIFKSILI
jgi:hypothetical protein